MITTLFIKLAFYLISSFVYLLPAGGVFPPAFHSAVTSLGGYLHILDPLVPIDTLLICVTAVFTVEIAIFGFKTFNWITSHIPFVGGKG